MLKIKYYLLAAVAMLAISACDNEQSTENDPSVEGDSNFWYVNGMVSKGIKSITNDYGNYTVTENYDSDGRLTSYVTPDGNVTYTYNSNGLPVKIVDNEQYGDKKNTSTTTFEYNNSSKFCPIPMSPGNIFHIFEQGLLPGLSKVTFYLGDEGSAVMEYKFQGDKLTVTTTCKNMTMWDDKGEEVPAEYDDIIFEYEGNYPYKYSGEHEFLGPLTYQDNGMFDKYIEGFYSWQTPGFVTMKRTRTISKTSKKFMLVEKETDEWYNDGESKPYDIETIVFTYNDKGDVIKEEITHTAEYAENSITSYEYEYDSKGNWTKMSGNIKKVGETEPYNSWTQERKVIYY